MHKIKVLLFAPENFNISLEELKEYLSFDLAMVKDEPSSYKVENYDVLMFHQEYIKKNSLKDFPAGTGNIRILVCNSTYKKRKYFSDVIILPMNVETINNTVENSVVKKSFSVNSSINLKGYQLNKNEKKLIKSEKFILLTEKEIQLLELFLSNSEPINKSTILEKVWKYSKSADTHTVETHIYRLRKKIKSKFQDDNFILNNKNGYLF